jgi:Zn ribbon nucleic-acid-binding protein
MEVRVVPRPSIKGNKHQSIGNVLGWALLLVASALPAAAASGTAKPSNLDAFAQCLTQKKVLMYGSSVCPHCADQKKLFGSSFKYVTYVECFVPGSRQGSPACVKADIHAVPTWVFPNGARLVGEQSLQMLSAATGCPLP